MTRTRQWTPAVARAVRICESCTIRVHPGQRYYTDGTDRTLCKACH